ncbi:MAG TPA: hypothetical protein VFJ75_04750 [Gaiellaceae bacterium]|nr:hypothetical protein [Gaiellaceae bacterium]
MQRPGVMAPPDLYERPASPGLMSPGAAHPAPVDLKLVLWTIAAVLAALELCLELTAA